MQTITGASGFGSSIDVSGNWLAIGAPGANQVRIYQRSGESWNYYQAINGGSGTSFGASVAIEQQQNELVVGMPTASAVYWSQGQPDVGYKLNMGVTGGAVVYTYNGYSWNENRLLMPDDSGLPYDTSYSNTVTPAGEGSFGLRIYDGGTWYYFSIGTAGTKYSLDYNTPDGNIKDNTVEVRVGPNTHVQLIDSHWYGDSTLDVYNNSYSDYAWYDVPFTSNVSTSSGIQDFSYMRNAADEVKGWLIGPASTTYSGDNYFSALNGAQWGSSVQIAGNTVYVGAQGYNGSQGRTAVYNLAAGDYTHWTATIGGITDVPLRSTNYINGTGSSGAEIAVRNANDIYVGQPGASRVQEYTQYGGYLYTGSNVFSDGSGFGGNNTVDASGYRELVGATGAYSGTGVAYLYNSAGSYLQTLQPYYYDKTYITGNLIHLGTNTMQVDTNSSLHFGVGDQLISEGFEIVGTANTNITANEIYDFRQRGPAFTPVVNTSGTDLLVPEALQTNKTGSSVSIDGDTAAVGAMDYDNRGAVFIFTAVAGTDNWALQATIQATDIQHDDAFGSSVSISGDSLIVGAPDKLNNEGAVYLFQRLGTAWTQKSEFIGTANSLLGTAVDVFGTTAVAGAPGADTAYFYDYDGVKWTVSTVAVGAKVGLSVDFGASVAINQDTAVVGAPVSNSRIGAAEVYIHSGSNWNAEYQLTPSDGVVGEEFGAAVDVSGDIIAVGAPGANHAIGEIYTYQRSGSVWGSEQLISLATGAPGDYFGAAVALDNGELVVGAYGRSRFTYGFSTNAVDVEGGSSTTPLADADNNNIYLGAGQGLQNGDTVIYTATDPSKPIDGLTSGQQYVVIFDSSKPDEVQLALANSPTTPIALSRTGSDSSVIHNLRKVGGGEGAAYAYRLKDGAWVLETPIDPLSGSDSAAGDEVGYSVALSGSLAILGAPQLLGRSPYSTGAINTDGAGYVYIRQVSPPVTVTVLEEQDLLIAGAKANTITGTLGGVQTADLKFFDITNVTLTTGAGDDNITISADGLTAFGLLNFTVDTDGGNDTLTELSDPLKPPAAGSFVPSGDFSGLKPGDPLPPGVSYVQLNGVFTYNGGSGENTLVAQADTDWTLDTNTLTAGNGDTMDLANVHSVRLVGGSSANRLEVKNWAGDVTLDGGGGADQYVVDAAALGAVTVADSGSSSDLNQLTVIGTAGDDHFLVSGTQVWLGTQTMDYTGVQVIRIAGEAGNDTLDVADAAAAKVILDGGEGSDTYDVFAGTSTAEVYVSDSGTAATDIDKLNVSSSSVSVGGTQFNVGSKTVHYDSSIEQLGFTTVTPILTLSGSSGDDTITLTATTLTINSITVDLTGVIDLTIDSLGGNDSFVVQGVPSTLTHTDFIGGDGNDSIFGPNGSNTWNITGVNAGNVTGDDNFDFSGIENITGGSGADRFVFANNGAQLAGDLNGGGGNDTLDYSGRTAGVTFDYGAATSTGIGGNVSNIETLIGSAGMDTLIGSDGGDTWNITGANSGDINGALSFSGFENATGGSGGDLFLVSSGGSLSGTIDGGDGDDEIDFTMTDAADTVNVGGSVVTRNGADTSYQNFETLDVNTLGGADSITVNPSASGFPTTVNINSGDDDDIVTINLLAGVDTTINVDGGAPSASDSVIVNGTSGDDAISVDDLTVTYDATRILLSGIENLTVAGGDGNDTLELSGTSVPENLTLLGGAGDDLITLNYGIATGNLTVDGGTGANDALVVNSTGSVNDVTLDSTQIQIAGQATANYANFDTLALNLGDGADNVTIADTNAGTATVINAGAGDDTITILGTSGVLNVNAGDGHDTINVLAIAGATTVNAGSGDDTINVGSLAPDMGGNVNAISALLTISGGDGSDTLNVDDSGDTTANTGTLTATMLTGLGMSDGIAYSELEDLNISLGSGGDTFTIASTHAGTTVLNTNAGADTVNVQTIAGATTVNAGSGNDTINVGSLAAPDMGGGVVDGIRAPLTVSGGDGSDTLNVDDSGDTTANTGTLTATMLTGLGMSDGIAYSELEDINISLGSGDDFFTIASTHAGTTTLNTNAGNDTVNVLTTSGVTTVNAGDGADIVNVQSIGAEATVNGGSGDDTINVGSLAPDMGGNVNAISALLTISGGDGSDTLNVDDSGDTTANTGTLTATMLTGLGMSDGIAYSELEDLNISLGSGDDFFTIASTHAGTTVLNTNGGADMVNVVSTAGVLTVNTGMGSDIVNVLSTGAVATINTGDDNDMVNIQTIGAAMMVNAGSGDDTINVGSLAPDMGGNINAISALLTISGGDGSDTLNVDDSGDTTANTGTLTATMLTGLGMSDGIAYSELEDLNISLGSGGDTFTIASTHAGTTVLNTNAGADTVNVQTIAGATTVNAGSGNDTINVGSLAPVTGGVTGGISAPLTLNGQDGNDTLNVDDTGDVNPATLTLTATTITGLGMSDGITYGTFENLNLGLGSGGNSLNIRSLGTATTINTGNGDDTINVGSLAPDMGGNVNAINAWLTLNGQGGNDTLNVDDTGDTIANTGLLTATTLSGLGMSGGGINYFNMEAMEISLGSGGNTFAVTGTMNRSDFRTITMLNTGAGNDQVLVSLNAATDGPLAVNLEDGNDFLDASTSTLGLIIFGGLGSDTIIGGQGADAIFGDRGVVDYYDASGNLVTRLGIGVGERSTDPNDPNFVPAKQTDGGFGELRTFAVRDAQLGGDDILIGGLGDDQIWGGAGNDIMLGGIGQVTRTYNADGSLLRTDVLLLDEAYITGSIALDGSGVPCGDLATVNALLNADVALLTGAYNADGTKSFNSDHSWNESALLLNLVSDGNDVMYGGDGNDAMYGQSGNDILRGETGNDFVSGGTGNDTIDGGDGNDTLVGDDAFIDTTGSAIPNVTHGFLVVHSANSAEAGMGIDLGARGTVIVPMVPVAPGREVDAASFVLPQIFGYDPAIPSDNSLHTAAGGRIVPYASVITDFGHHLGLLHGDDMITGGNGNDTLVGDDMVVIAPVVTFDTATMAKAEAITRSLLDISDDFSDMVHRQYSLLGSDWSHCANIDCNTVMIDNVYSIGEDVLDGGAGNDVLIGDDSTMIAPSFNVPANLATKFEMFQDGIADAGDQMVDTVIDLVQLENGLRDTLIQVTSGKHVYTEVQHHVDLLMMGNDILYGGDGNDFIVGDSFEVRAPTVTVTMPVPGTITNGRDWRDDEGWYDHGERSTWWTSEGWRGHDGYRLDAIEVGSDVIYGGAGNDLIFGDSVYMLGGTIIRASGVGSRDFAAASSEIGEGLDRLMTVYGGTDQWVEFSEHDHDHSNDKYSWAHGSDQDRERAQHHNYDDGDTIFGGDGSDIIFGQGGGDVLHGDAGDDWLIGGSDQDSLDGGSGKNKLYQDYIYSKQLHDLVSAATPTVDWSGKTGSFFGANVPVSGNGCSSPWLDDFLNNLGQSAGNDPNANLVITI